MSIYLGEKLFAGRNSGGSNESGGGGITVNTLYSGSLANGQAGALTDSYKNYDFLVAVAGISGSKNYQFSGFFSVADIPESGTRQLYLSTPFELNSDKTMKSYCGMVVSISGDTTIDVVSKFAGWSSGTLFKLYGIKFSA